MRTIWRINIAMTKDKFLIAKYIDESRENIIAKYEQDIPISAIAKLYNVSHSVIYLRLVKWGVRIKKYAIARRRRIEKPRKHYKRKFSKEFLAHQAEITKLNDGKIKYVKFEGTTEDQKLVSNILCRPVIG